eukprot:SAG31_NODE_19033_length_614_cov_0.586408_2_plen_148_part_01
MINYPALVAGLFGLQSSCQHLPQNANGNDRKSITPGHGEETNVATQKASKADGTQMSTISAQKIMYGSASPVAFHGGSPDEISEEQDAKPCDSSTVSGISNPDCVHPLELRWARQVDRLFGLHAAVRNGILVLRTGGSDASSSAQAPP